MTTIPNVRHEVLAGGKVKGAMVRAHLQFVRDRLGEGAVAQTLQSIPAPVAQEVQSVLTSTWCAFESLILLDRAIARVARRDERELMRELGRYSAQINLTGVYRAFNRDDIHEFFRHSATLHRQFQDFGTCVYEHIDQLHGRISVRDAACFSPAYCASETGYLEQVIATHGGTSVSVTESLCKCANDDRCTFELKWH
jgi:predicted hydrocarbon binding protein